MSIILLCAIEDLQVLLEGLVSSSTGSIYLRVIGCTNVLLDV